MSRGRPRYPGYDGVSAMGLIWSAELLPEQVGFELTVRLIMPAQRLSFEMIGELFF
jgi:hypothetical protein